MSKIIKAKEAADILGIHPKTLKKYEDTGKIPAIGIVNGFTGHRTYREEDIIALKQRVMFHGRPNGAV